MATLEEATRARLSGDEALTALVGDRIRPLMAAQPDALPYLTYQITTQPITHLTGESEYRRATVEVGIFAATYGECVVASNEVRRVLHLYGGTTAGVEFAPAMLDEESEVDQGVQPGDETPVYYRTQTYAVLFRLA
jgi:hypothetical protein